MAYATYNDFVGIYGAGVIPQTDFARLEAEAEMYADALTTGIDNVRKLAVAFPEEEHAAERVRFVICRAVKQIYDVEKAEQAAAVHEDGRPGVVSSVSSGAESISYASGDSSAMQAAKNPEFRRGYIHGNIAVGLAGVTDKNGVNLLYMGEYPCTKIR